MFNSVGISTRILVTIICVWFCVGLGHTQIRVIDNKGTLRSIDTSKWTLNGADIFNKNSGSVGIGTNSPQAKLHTNGTLRFQALATNTVNTNILSTDINGNVTTRTLANLLSGSAITSLNGLTNSIQTFATGTVGSDFGISSSGSVHTFNLPTASSTVRGLLSSANWTTFNNKENAITAGTTLQYWRGDKTWQTLNTTAVPEGSSLYYTDARARTALSLTTTGTSGVATYNNTTGVFNIPNYTDGGITSLNGLTALSQTFATGTAGSDFGISSSGSVHTFNLPTASSTVRGLLSAANWTSFNNKITSVSGTSPITAITAGTSVTVDINRNNIVAGTSSTAATSPLTLDAGATNAVVGGANATLTVNNTAALWNANQLQGRNITSTAPTAGQVLGYDGTNWLPVTALPQVLVDANRTSTYTTAAAYTTLVYNTAAINVGTAYNTTSGVFTAPATGLYHILVNNIFSGINVNDNYLRGRIIANGNINIESVVLFTLFTGATSYNSMNMSTILTLTSGQTLNIQTGGEQGSVDPETGTGQHNLKIIRLN